MSRRTWLLVGSVLAVALATTFVVGRLVAPPAAHVRTPEATPQPSEALPSIVLVTIDTLRVDRLGVHGHQGGLTPTLDRLAHAGALFANSYATSSWTVPSMVSMLTGVYPSRHGVTSGVVREGAVHGQQRIPDDLPVLAERLRERGYRTFAVTANAHLHPDFGFARGFDRFECVGFRRANALLDVLAAWKDEILSSPRFFLWLHLFDPHAPYVPEPDWLPAHWDPRPRFADLEHVHPARRYEQLNVLGERLAYVEALYDGSVRAADAALGHALALLDAEKRALVVVTSDHGEELADHGRFDHGHSLYDELVHVPLLLRFPDARFAGKVVTASASLVDVLPTIAEVAGVEPAKDLHGRSLLPLLRGEPFEPRGIVAELARGIALVARREDGFKLIHDVTRAKPNLLFDLAVDPDERFDLVADRAAHAAEIERRLLGDLSAWSRTQAGPSVPVDPEHLKALRSMGYVE